MRRLSAVTLVMLMTLSATAAAQEAPPPDDEAGTPPDPEERPREGEAEIRRTGGELKEILGAVEGLREELKTVESEIRSDIEELKGDREVVPPPRDADGCNGFGLLAPLFGVSNRGIDPTNPNQRQTLRITGPVQSGIGGGYYWAFGKPTCRSDWTAGYSVFGFSEGLNPNDTFQIGAGGALQLTVRGRVAFSFGLGLGVDLIRREVREFGGVERSYSNGLLIFNDVAGCTGEGRDPHCMLRNLTLLLTFNVATGDASEDAEEGEATPADPGDG